MHIIRTILTRGVSVLRRDTNVSGWGTVKIEKARAELLVTMIKINILISFEETQLPLHCRALHTHHSTKTAVQAVVVMSK